MFVYRPVGRNRTKSIRIKEKSPNLLILKYLCIFEWKHLKIMNEKI